MGLFLVSGRLTLSFFLFRWFFFDVFVFFIDFRSFMMFDGRSVIFCWLFNSMFVFIYFRFFLVYDGRSVMFCWFFFSVFMFIDRSNVIFCWLFFSVFLFIYFRFFMVYNGRSVQTRQPSLPLRRVPKAGSCFKQQGETQGIRLLALDVDFLGRPVLGGW